MGFLSSLFGGGGSKPKPFSDPYFSPKATKAIRNTYYNDPFGTEARAQITKNSSRISVNNPYLKEQGEGYHALLGNVFDRLGQPDENRLNEYEKAFYQRAVRPIEDEYQRGMLAARDEFNSRGMLDSTGYEDYRRDNLEKLRQEGLREAAQDALLAREQLLAGDTQRLLNVGQFGQTGFGDVADLGLRYGDMTRLGNATFNDVMRNFFLSQLQRAGMRGQFMYGQ